MTMATTSGASYFGKLPSRGDFIKGGHQFQLIDLLDRWTSASMERLAENPRWKLLFDSAPALDFAFVAARSQLAVVGHLKPSRDTAGRRFPFLAASAVAIGSPSPFRYGPIGFSALWDSFRRIVGQASVDGTPGNALGELARLDCRTSVACRLAGDPLDQFARTTTLAQLAFKLGPRATPQSVRRQILAIGLLLKPVLGRHALSIEKGLNLPLPTSPHERSRVAALWLYLVSVMLRDSPCELQLLLGRINGHERMVIGFNGACPRTLLGLLAPPTLDGSTIMLDNPDWIDSHPDLRTDSGVARLAACLAQPSISLGAVIATFSEAFQGD